MNKEFGGEVRIYEGKVYGCEVSKYGLGHWYLDYLTLSKIIGDCILNNTVRSETAEVILGSSMTGSFYCGARYYAIPCT